MRESPPPPPESYGPVWNEVRRRIRELRGKRAFVWLMGSRLLFFMGLQSMDNFLQLFFRQGLGDDSPEGKTTIVLGTVLILAVLTSIPAGWASDRFGRLRLVADRHMPRFGVRGPSGVCTGFRSGCCVSPRCWAVGLGLFTAADWAAAIDLVPDARAAGLYMGLTNVATAGGDALATLSAGIALDVVNQFAPGYGFRAVFALMGLYFLLSVVVLTQGASCMRMPHQDSPGARSRGTRRRRVAVGRSHGLVTRLGNCLGQVSRRMVALAGMRESKDVRHNLLGGPVWRAGQGR